MFQRIRLLLLVAIVAGGLLLIGSLPIGTSAQGTPQDTPTNTGGDGSNGGDGGNGTVPPLKARVFGFVYDYSNASYQSGVSVVIDGGGWQVETVTDSNGYYEVGGLGVGIGILNLRLPKGTTPVVFDWPVRLGSGAELRVDLGYYWGDDPPIPVRLSAESQGNQLHLQVENRTSVTATGNMLEVISPASLRVLPPAQLNQGYIASYDSHQFQIGIDEIPPGETVSAMVTLEQPPSGARADQVSPAVRIVFTYDQQLTAQVLELEPAMDEVAPPVGSASGKTAQAAPVAESTVNPPVSTTPEVASTPRSGQPQVSSAAPAATGQTQPAMPESGGIKLPQQPEKAAEPAPGEVSPLPSTGSTVTSNGISRVVLSLVIGLTLGLAGWRALHPKRY